MDGTTTPNLPLAEALDEVIGNVTEDGQSKTRRQPVTSLAAQLVAAGPITAALAAEAEARAASQAQLESQIEEANTKAENALAMAGSGSAGRLQSVRVLATANVVIASGLVNGATVDGVVLATGNRVALTGQTTASQNGIYVVVAAGAAARATDADTGAELALKSFSVDAGSHAGEDWFVKTTPITVGTTAIEIIKARGAVGYEAEVIAARDGNPSLSDALSLKADVQWLDGIGEVLVDARGRVLRVTTPEGAIRTSAFELKPVAHTDRFLVVDKRGRVYSSEAQSSSGGSGGGGGSVSGFSDAEIDALNGWALAQSAVVVSNGNPNLARFTAYNNWVLEYGQSLSVGALSHPLKTTTALYNSMMIGDSVRSANPVNATFNPYGGVNVLNPLLATVTDGTSVLTSSQIEALDWMDTHSGETVGVGFAAFAKFLWNQSRAVADDPDRRFVVTSTGAGGLNITQLSNPSSYYGRTIDAAAKIKALSDAASKTAGCAAILYEQGESDTLTLTKAQWKTLFRTLMDGFHTDAFVGQLGQTLRPPILIYQTSGRWAVDGLEIAQAQLELATEERDVFMYSPAYPVTNKSDGHLDANGSRWLGMQAAKVWYRVSVLGQGWQPVRIRRAIHRGSEMLLAYHVPAPPLTFRDVYDGFTAVQVAQKGLRVVDEGGDNLILDAEIAPGGAVIKLTLGRPCVGVTTVYSGEKSMHNGNTNIADSDGFESLFPYVYDAVAGDNAEANIAALVNKLYPLNNWAANQVITAEAA